MEADVLWVLVLALLVGAGGVALGVWGLPKLARKRQGYPGEDAIEAALVPAIFYGICSAYRLSEWALREVGRAMDGADKKKIADALYGLLPERIGDFDVTVIKRKVPIWRFRQLVQDVFDRFDMHFATFEGRYQEMFWAWAAQFENPARETVSTLPDAGANVTPPDAPASPAL